MVNANTEGERGECSPVGVNKARENARSATHQRSLHQAIVLGNELHVSITHRRV